MVRYGTGVASVSRMFWEKRTKLTFAIITRDVRHRRYGPRGKLHGRADLSLLSGLASREAHYGCTPTRGPDSDHAQIHSLAADGLGLLTGRTPFGLLAASRPRLRSIRQSPFPEPTLSPRNARRLRRPSGRPPFGRPAVGSRRLSRRPSATQRGFEWFRAGSPEGIRSFAAEGDKERGAVIRDNEDRGRLSQP